MPRYRMPSGVVVDIPEAKAARIGGLTPADSAPPAPREPAKKTPPPVKRAHKDAPKPDED